MWRKDDIYRNSKCTIGTTNFKIYNNNETIDGNKKDWQTLHKLWMRQTQCRDL
jgi:hypothetical protein